MDSLFKETRQLVLRLVDVALAVGNARLPTDREIAASGTASYATVRLVMKQLEADGFIRRIRGSGTYLTPAAGELLKRQGWKRLLVAAPRDYGRANPRKGYFAWIGAALAAEAERRQWTVENRVAATHDDFIQLLSRQGHEMDAIVYLPASAPFTPRQIGALGEFREKPLVLMDVGLSNLALCNVTTDNYAGGRLAALWVLERGFSRPAVLVCEPRVANTVNRINGFVEALALRGLAPEVIEGGVDSYASREECGERAVGGYLDAGGRADVIFAISDAGAFGACRAVRDRGAATRVLGFDGLAAGEEWGLTSIAQPVPAMAAKVFDLVGDWGDDCARQFVFPPEVWERPEAAAPAPAAGAAPEGV